MTNQKHGWEEEFDKEWREDYYMSSYYETKMWVVEFIQKVERETEQRVREECIEIVEGLWTDVGGAYSDTYNTALNEVKLELKSNHT